MSSCKIKNNCPMCRAEIKCCSHKQLPKFSRLDMLDNLMLSYNNPFYNVFSLIDNVRDVIFEELYQDNDNISRNENLFKNSVLRRVEYCTDLRNNIDITLMDDIQEFVSKIIIDNTHRMIRWFQSNY